MSQTAIPTADESPADAKPKKPFDFDALPFAPLIVWFLSILLAVVCNSGSLLGQEWIWTDDALVARNPLIGNINGLQKVWTGMTDPSTYLLPQFSPLAQTMFFFERGLFGDNPVGYRVVSMVLHGSCAAVLYLLLRGLRLRGAVIATLLFVAHPVLVDSVSFLTERRNPLGGLLALSGLYMLLRGAGAIDVPAGRMKLLPDDKTRLYAMGAALMVVALFAQPAVAPLGLVGLILLWARRIKPTPALSLIAVGVAVVGAVLLSISSRVDIAQSGVTARAWERAPTAGEEIAVRTQIAGRASVFYLQKTLLPYPLSIDWGRWMTPNDLTKFRDIAPAESKARFAARSPDVGAGNFVAWLFPLAVAAALIALAALTKRIGRTPLAIAASFLLLLLPFLGFIDAGWMQYSFVSQRAMYLAVIPIMLGIALVLAPLLADPSQRVSMIASLAIVMIVMVRLGVGVSARYQYNLSFWRFSDIAANRSARPALNALTRTPWYSRFQAATSLIQYNPSELPKALDAYNDVLDRMQPGNSEVLVQLARVLYLLNMNQEAMSRLNFVMEHDPEYGLAYRAAGDVMRREADAAPTNPGPRHAALAYYEQAVEADPLDATARILLAETAWEIAKRLPESDIEQIQAKMQQAAAAFDAADEIRPYDVEQLIRESKTLTEMQLFPAAASRLQVARAVDPNNPQLLVITARTLMAGNQAKGAESAFRQVIESDEDFGEAYLGYSELLIGQERFDEAQTILETGVEKAPKDPRLPEALTKLKADVAAKASTQPSSQPAGN